MISVSFLEGVGGSFVWFLFALYLEELAYVHSSIGIMLMVMGLTSTLPLLPAGYLGDRFGRKRMVIFGTIITALSVLTIIQARSFIMLGLGAALWGLGHAFKGPAYIALLSEKVSEKRRKYLFSIEAFSHMISSGIAILAAGFMPSLFSSLHGGSMAGGFRTTFLIGLFFILAQLPLLMMLSEKKKYGMKDSEERTDLKEPIEKGSKKVSPIPWKMLAMLCFPMILVGIGAGLIIPFFQVYFVWRFDTPIEIIGGLFGLTNLLWGAAYLGMPFFADKVGSVKAITIVQWIAILALVGIPISPTFHLVAMMYVIRMVLMNSTWPILSSYSLSQVPEVHRSFTLSATNFSFNVPKGMAPGIAGFIYEFSLELPFFICAAFYVASTVMFFLVFRKRDDKEGKGHKHGLQEEE